jgi:hypothetical protein
MNRCALNGGRNYSIMILKLLNMHLTTKNITSKLILAAIGLLMLLGTPEALAQRSFKLATNYEAYQKLYNSNVKIARTKAEFAQMAKRNERLRAVFDRKTLRAFMSKLKMGEKGLVTFSYASIKQKFPKGYEAEVDLVLAAFGWGPMDSLPVDYPNNYCESKATCSTAIDSICIGDNC